MTLCLEAVESESIMNQEIQNSINAISRPDVLTMIQELSKYGLGVCVPHMHNNEEGFAQLPNDIVAVEENLVVSFKHRASIIDAIPVAWRWNEELQAVQMCQCCNVGHCSGDRDSGEPI